MIAVEFDDHLSDDERRRELYHGGLFIYSPTATTQAFCAFARELIEEAFPGMDPETAQHNMPVERYAAILSELKPRFIHHIRSKQFVRDILAERGCDLDQTYFDVPRMRSSTSNDYLTTGIAYAWHPHRDTWYSAPSTQINWWMPIYPIAPGNGMAFHPGYIDRPAPNTSQEYNYYEWNQKHRRAAAGNLKQETRPLPRPLQPLEGKKVTFVTPPGGLQIFSGAKMHSSVPNQTGKTRWSIDFRTVHIGDVAQGLGAPNVDAQCTGSSIRDFIRARDFAPMPEEIVRLFDDGTEKAASELVYEENVRAAEGARSRRGGSPD